MFLPVICDFNPDARHPDKATFNELLVLGSHKFEGEPQWTQRTTEVCVPRKTLLFEESAPEVSVPPSGSSAGLTKMLTS